MDRATFMEGLRAFHESQGRAFRPQKVSGYLIDPYKMFLLIVSRGGFSRVNKNSRWFVFGKPLGIDIPDGKQQEIGLGIKTYYLNWLRDYEKAMDDGLKLSIAMEFATNNPELVPNPGLALSSYGASASGNIMNGAEEAPPLTRSAAASLSRSSTRGPARPDLSNSGSGAANGGKGETGHVTERNVYLIPRGNCLCGNEDTKTNRVLNPDSSYSPKYPVSDDMWYLLAHFKNPEATTDRVIHILNNLQSLAANKKLFLSSFPSLLDELSEAISLCTFSIDSLIQRKMAERSLLVDFLNLQKLKQTIMNKTCLLSVDQIQKDLLGSLSSLVSSILEIKENCDFIFDLTFSPSISRDFFRIGDLENKDAAAGESDCHNSSFGENKVHNSHPNTLKPSYLSKGTVESEILKSLKDEFINHSGREFGEKVDSSLHVFNIESLFCSLYAAFRTSSSLIISYERLLHNIIQPLLNNHRDSRIKAGSNATKLIILKMKSDSSEFSVEERLETECKDNGGNLGTIKDMKEGGTSDIEIRETSVKGKINMDLILERSDEVVDHLGDNIEERSVREDELSDHIQCETEMSWLVLSSVITSLNQLLPFVFERGLNEIIVLINFFVQELFGECHICNNFSVPILSKCGEKVKGHSFSLPCLIYNPEGMKFLSDLLEFGCNIIVNISSNNCLNKSKYDVGLVNGFFQMILKLSSICIGFHSLMKTDCRDLDNFFCLKQEGIKKRVNDLFDQLVFPLSLVTVATVSEHVPFEKIFHSVGDLKYHYLSHHTQFTQSLIKSKTNCQIDPQVLEMSDSNDSFLKDQILVLWGREVIGPIFELLRNEMLCHVSNGGNETPLSCIMLSQYIIFVSSELVTWNSSHCRKRDSLGMHSKSSREIAIGILTPFIDVLIELAWLPSKYRNLFWSIISELSKFGVSNPSFTLGLTKVGVELIQDENL